MDFKHIKRCARVPATPLEALDHSAVMVHASLRVITILFELRHAGGAAGTGTTTMIIMLGRVSHNDPCPCRGVRRPQRTPSAALTAILPCPTKRRPFRSARPRCNAAPADLAALLRSAEAAGDHEELYDSPGQRQIGHASPIPAMDTSGNRSARWTQTNASRCPDRNNSLILPIKAPEILQTASKVSQSQP